jgi:hypothetical protein
MVPLVYEYFCTSAILWSTRFPTAKDTSIPLVYLLCLDCGLNRVPDLMNGLNMVPLL